MRRLALAAVLALAAAAVPGCGLLGDGGSYRITAYFDRAVSVFPSSDVRVLGLPAGSVAAVEVEGDRVRVDMDVDDDVRLPVDARAQIVPQSLIGERYIQISPAHVEGEEALEDGDVIETTIIPVEPDEALAALKELLDSLDPEGIGRLVGNLEESLAGNGEQLGDALGSLSEMVTTFAEKDEVLLRIVDSFDRLSATLVTREQQLGEVLDAFAEATNVLASERQGIEDLVSGLADLSRNGLALLGDHAGPLRDDIETLAAAAATIDANLASVTQLLAAGPTLAEGIIGAYNPSARAVNLRNNFGPLVPEALAALLGIDYCSLFVGIDCPLLPLDAGSATPAQIDAPPTPVAALVELMAAPTEPAPPPGPSLLERGAGAVADAARTFLGVDR